MCSISRTQFGRKKRGTLKRKTQKSHEETQEEEEQAVTWRRILKKAIED